MNKKPLISIDHLRFSWPKQTTPCLIIDEWSVHAEQRVFLYGPSGSGKSTLLNLLAGILLPQHGTIAIDGNRLSELKANQRDRFRANNMGIIFQQFNLVPYLNITDNIRLSSHFAGMDFDPQRLQELTSRLGLSSQLLHHKANELSVGQQQRVAVARALYHQPTLIIADEPTSALDSEARDGFIELLLSESARCKSAVVFVSHDKSLARYFDSQINLDDLNQAATRISEGHHAE